jgi:hydroxymethylbilane synthase
MPLRSPTCSTWADVATIRIATRGSAQARTQAGFVAEALAVVGFETELVLVETFGDRTQADGTPLHTIGGQGVFVKEVQRAVLDGRADLAVHSAKDLPTETAEGLVIAAFTERRNAADALVGRSLIELPAGATVATGSVRRRAQIGRARPDLEFVELRGNIHTRLEKLPEDGAVVVAVAALEILGLTDRIAERLDPAEFVPAVGQGCVAVECRADDDRVRSALGRIDHPATRREVTIERAFLAELGSGCSLPVGAYVDGAKLYAFLAGEATGITVSETIELSGDLDADVEIARSAARSAHAHVAAP